MPVNLSGEDTKGRSSSGYSAYLSRKTEVRRLKSNTESTRCKIDSESMRVNLVATANSADFPD